MTDQKRKIKEDWHRADIIAAVRKTKTNLQQLSRRFGLGRTTLSNALYSPCPKYERLIAEQIGTVPQVIWPSRYNADGTPKSGRGERGLEFDYPLPGSDQPSKLKPDVLRQIKYSSQGSKELVSLTSREINKLQNDSEFNQNELASFTDHPQFPDRAQFIEHLKRFISYAQRHDSRKIAVVVVRLDQLRQTTLMIGEESTHSLLTEIALRLNQNMPVAYLGGDEFAVLRTGKVEDDVHMQDAVNEVKAQFALPFQIQGGEMLVSANFGVALYPTHGHEAEELLGNATASFPLFGNTRSESYFYSPALIASAKQRLFLESALHYAQERNELSVHFQPQIDVLNKHMVGLEALLRWNHPEFGLVKPDEFLPIAESTELILPMGLWVIRKACEEFQALRKQGHKQLKRITVNISARQFHDKDFSTALLSILRNTGVEPTCLELELSESMLMQQTEQSLKLMKDLHDRGVHISLDDFGTGYSNLSYINQFPIDSIKIDKSFVHGLTHDVGSLAIAEAILSIARRLSLRVVAEGVETKVQMDILQDMGCLLMQGFYFYKPMPAADINKLPK